MRLQKRRGHGGGREDDEHQECENRRRNELKLQSGNNDQKQHKACAAESRAGSSRIAWSTLRRRWRGPGSEKRFPTIAASRGGAD